MAEWWQSPHGDADYRGVFFIAALIVLVRVDERRGRAVVTYQLLPLSLGPSPAGGRGKI